LFLDELTRNIKHDIQILDTLDGFDKKDQVIAEMYFLNNCKKKDIAEKVGFINIKSVNNQLKRIKGFFINKYENTFLRFSSILNAMSITTS
jgi:predicted membrane-bound dolichyl-phosphate-mannose-protein mannosyltransferase